MYAKLRAIPMDCAVPEASREIRRISILLTHHIGEREIKSEELVGETVVIDLHFDSGANNFATISGEWVVHEDGTPVDGREPDSPGFYTITCVADFMWFLLSVCMYHRIRIVECRPDPWKIMRSAMR